MAVPFSSHWLEFFLCLLDRGPHHAAYAGHPHDSHSQKTPVLSAFWLWLYPASKYYIKVLFLSHL